MLVSLEVEAILDGCRSAVVFLRVRRVGPGGIVPIAHPLRSVGEHFVVVVRGQRLATVHVGGSHRDLGLVVIGLHLGEGDRPVEQVRPGDATVGRPGGELVGLEARRRAGPVGCGASDGLHDPRGKVGEVARDAPRTGGGAWVEPRHLVERLPLVVDVVLVAQVWSGFKQHHRDATLGELVGERSTACSRSDDDDRLVGLLEGVHLLTSACSAEVAPGWVLVSMFAAARLSLDPWVPELPLVGRRGKEGAISTIGEPS